MELKSMERYESNKESETLSSYNLSLMDVSGLTKMNKTLLDVAYESLDPNYFTKS